VAEGEAGRAKKVFEVAPARETVIEVDAVIVDAVIVDAAAEVREKVNEDAEAVAPRIEDQEIVDPKTEARAVVIEMKPETSV